MWRHIRMLKRGGRSYDSTGIEGTSPGELAIVCPACPIPSINLPPNWHSIGKDLEYVSPPHIHQLSLIIFIPGISTISHSGSMPAFGSRGGRFRAMRKIQNWDPGMHTSLHGTHTASISVASLIRKRFVVLVSLDLASTNMFGKQMSTCSGLSALDHANSKYSKGYATSGIVCTTCRHEFVLPEGAGPLQKGERLVSHFISFVYMTNFHQKVCQYRLRGRQKYIS